MGWYEKALPLSKDLAMTGGGGGGGGRERERELELENFSLQGL